MRHVILGNSAAGFSAATQIRQLNKEDEVIIISKETTPIYAKIMLPYYVGDDIERDKLFLKQLDFYSQNNIELILGKRAQFIDVQRDEVLLDDGTTYKYDNLLIGVGGVPFVAPITNIDNINYFTINCLDDADIIKQSIKEGDRALIVGTGLTGVEMAFGLSKAGMDVVLVERGDTILPMLLGHTGSRIMASYLEKAGVEIFLQNTVDRIEPANGQSIAVLSDETSIPFDIFIFAIGSRPNISIVEGSPIDVSKGIKVDEYMRTSVPNVFAAGDVAELNFEMQDGCVSSYIWPNAMVQGKCAATNMLGYNKPFDASGLQNTVQIKDIPFFSSGLVRPTQPGYSIKSKHDDALGIYKKLVTKDGCICGVQMIGDISGAREAASHIKKKSRLSADELEKYISI